MASVANHIQLVPALKDILTFGVDEWLRVSILLSLMRSSNSHLNGPWNAFTDPDICRCIH